MPPVLPQQNPAEWELFHTGILDDLRPAGVLEHELTNRIAGLMWQLRRATAFEVADAVAAQAADPARPPRLGWADTSSLKNLGRELEDRESVLRDVRRLTPLALALIHSDDGDRVQPDAAAFLLDQAAEVVQVSLPVPTTTFDENGRL